jgi:cysteate synthase
MMTGRRRHVRLVCCVCSREYRDHRLRCDTCVDALLRTVYSESRLTVSCDPGIFRFKSWLPVSECLATPIGPTMITVDRYAERLGLKRLSVAFNGYWPERGAFNVTGTFKDLEAIPSILYFRDRGLAGVVMASAGNTARAFAYGSSLIGFPCLIVVPERMAHRLWLPRRPAESVQVVAVEGNACYNTAIRISQHIAERFGIPDEGGARNAARRDGLGTTMLEYARSMGTLPRHYVQAVGSGAGAIATYEAGLRLRADGRFGTMLPSLHLVQNTPVTPIHDRWSRRQPEIPVDVDADMCGRTPPSVYADVLANHTPLYDAAGAVAEALRHTDGATYAVSEGEAQTAKAVFEQSAGVSINEAAACACAGLAQAVASGRVRPDESVLLNITGGGENLIRRDYDVVPVPPTYRVRECDVETLDLRFP